MTQTETVRYFYECLNTGNVDGLLSCYHSSIVFQDPVFGELKGERACNMWRMLLSKVDSNSVIEVKTIKSVDKNVLGHSLKCIPL